MRRAPVCGRGISGSTFEEVQALAPGHEPGWKQIGTGPVGPVLSRWNDEGKDQAMGWTPQSYQLPQSEHLREDINLPEEPELPGEEGAAQFSEETYTSTALNAGQQVPGLSPHGEYRRSDNPEHQTAATGGTLASPEES
jgi:hypothetical protein